MISLTPGTLSLDVAPDRSAIYIHAISVYEPGGQDVIDGIKDSLEKHISRALGPQANEKRLENEATSRRPHDGASGTEASR